MTDYLLALVADQLAIANHLFVRANAKPGTHVPPPQFVPRPDVGERPRRRAATAAELSRHLAGRAGTVRYHPKGHG